jgi:hypothetical protein
MSELHEYKQWLDYTLDRTSNSNNYKVKLHRKWLKKELQETIKLIKEQEEFNVNTR